MTRHRFYTADVFTDSVFGGNPLAVFPDAGKLPAARMQQIARELNLSETVFVLPPENPAHTRKLRIFTPGVELPFAGHPTVGSAFVLASIGEVDIEDGESSLVFEEGVGPVPVVLRSSNGKPEFAQLAVARTPEFGPAAPEPARVAETLSVEKEALHPEIACRAVSCGVPFLVVPLRDRTALSRVQLDRAAWRATLAGSWAPHVYCIAIDEQQPEIIHARMFAPAMGIDEDPATGAAATALAAFLADDAPGPGTLKWTVKQGEDMGRPGVLNIEADRAGDAVSGIRVGGASVMVSDGFFEVPAG